MKEIENSTDILIAGAGPSGLMMACQLALQNISFRIIDKKGFPPIFSGALIIHARTMEIFRQMNITEKILKEAKTAKKINIGFNDKKNMVLDFTDAGEYLTCYPYLVMLEQYRTENILKEFLIERGHLIESNTSLLSFTNDNEFITSKILKSDGSFKYIKSRFLIGADGHDSMVRAQLKIPFPGKTFNSLLFISDCKARVPVNTDEIFFSFTSEYTAGFFLLPNNSRRVDGIIPSIQQKKEVSFNDVKEFFSRNNKAGIELFNSQWFSVFRSHSRCADSFRKNRCFLIGDAAHVHSPVGAQGMNTGIQDAYNLAWKLAFYVNGKTTEKILDTFQKERRPVALNIIRYTDSVFSFITSNFFLIKSIRLFIVPFILSMFLKILIKSLKLRALIFTSISGIGIKYKKSILTNTLSTEKFPSHSPKPGERWPYQVFEIRGRISTLHDSIDNQNLSLFIFGKQTMPAHFQMLIDTYSDAITVKHIANESGTKLLFEKLGLKNEGCYLIRPDLYIAWRSREFDTTNLMNFLKKFLRFNFNSTIKI